MKKGKSSLAVIGFSLVVLILLSIFGCGEDIKGVADMRFGIDIRGGVEAVFEPDGIERKATEDELETARNVIESRLDSQNITDREVTVDQEGGYIIVRFPWKSDETDFNPEDAILELGEMAKLTFRAPDGTVLLEGKNVESSSAEKDSSNMSNEWVVALNFDSEGAKLFEEATGAHVGENIGIYMDEELISNPVVEAKISGGQAVINGMADMEEAQKLSEKINAGALPFSLKTSSFSTISPSLGNNALNIMVVAGVISFFVVCIFMIAYYKFTGIVACITLTMQMLIQLLAISIPQYTLTLSGIAGIILSMGMAVDANIIISERISEEIQRGNSVRMAVKAGYKNAFSSVLDGNVTTAIVAIILMLFGSGSMLSFGYTLMIGMIVNVFVGVSVSKKILLSLLESEKFAKEKYFRKKKELKVKRFYENTKIYAAISAVIILVGIVACFVKGVSLDTQFTGGVVLSYETEAAVDTGKIETAVEKASGRPVTVQITEDNTGEGRQIKVTLAGNSGMTPEEQQEINDTVKECLDGADAEQTETYVVEPYIGAKALKNSVIAIALSSIFILIYVWVRFSAISGLLAGITALIALVHDVLVVFFSFVLFGIPLNDAFVAVVLTIIGYSINDTIVMYDRIRENRGELKDKSIGELVNISVSQTFGRSINTSFTTGVCVLIILVASIVFQLNSIFEFSLPMFFGIISGCYSSICIAGGLWAVLEKRKEK